MTARDRVLTVMVVATIISTPSSVKARRTRAREPSVAYPRPQADRRSR
jgi:hypothetical protein